MAVVSSGPRWHFLLRPRWLCWHAFAVAGTIGMLWLGDWQLRRALSGNELSWAYTFEWPLFAVFGVYFYARSIRDELRIRDAGPGPDAAGTVGDPAGTGLAETDEAYLARLQAEVRGHGRWHGFR